MLLNTHIVSDVEYIAGRIFLMKDGRIAISGTAQELVDSMPERVWLCQVPKARIEAYLKALKVSNVKNTPEGAELRIVSAEQPTDDAVQVAATLEDVFLCYFGQRGGEEDASL